MRVGIIGGTGPLGRGLAVRLAGAGIGVDLGSREPARALAVADDLRKAWPDHALDLVGAGNEEVARCELVVVATPWEAATSTVRPLGDQLAGKVVVSVGNALVRRGREMHALVLPRGSVAAELQAALPDSRLAGAGHHLPAADLEDMNRFLQSDVLVCSDHPEATSATIDLFSRIAGLRALDAGSLASASAIEAFTAVLVTVNLRYRAHSSLKLAGLQHVEPSDHAGHSA